MTVVILRLVAQKSAWIAHLLCLTIALASTAACTNSDQSTSVVSLVALLTKADEFNNGDVLTVGYLDVLPEGGPYYIYLTSEHAAIEDTLSAVYVELPSEAQQCPGGYVQVMGHFSVGQFGAKIESVSRVLTIRPQPVGSAFCFDKSESVE